MLVTPSAMITFVRLLQLSKANSPMLVTLFGIVTSVKLLQASKALFPMLVTGFPPSSAGMSTLLSEPK